MSEDPPLYDNPKSPKNWKKGDRRKINGVEMESQGPLEDAAKENPEGPPGHVRDKHLWYPVKKPDDAVPTS